MFLRILKVCVLIAAVFAVAAVATSPDVSFAQSQTKSTKKSSSKPKITVPPGGCLIADAAIENGKTCAAGCKNDWCTVSWCVNGQLSGSWIGCYEPSKLCVPKC